MKLNIQKRLAARLLKCSKKRVKLDPDRSEELKESITKIDLRNLIKDNCISRVNKKGISSYKKRKKIVQKRKGRQDGVGSRKGKTTARLPKKDKWMNTIRAQRKLLKELKDKKILPSKTYYDLYRKAKGGFFRSKRHLKIYVKEHNLAQKAESKNGKKNN